MKLTLKNNNLVKTEINNKNEYYEDLEEIENTMTGRVDVLFANGFIYEAIQQLKNAIELFEKGFFDCAYYSLRSAVDMSMTITFLADLSDEERAKYLSNWESGEFFPGRRKIFEYLKEHKNVYDNMKKEMPDFFRNSKELSKCLNKYVHKQGFQHFYVNHELLCSKEKYKNNFTSKFCEYLEKCITVVAVMRLAIDPFPILLSYEEIIYRCFDTLTYAYSDNFINKYIGKKYLIEYKHTSIYCDVYDYFISKHRKNQATYQVSKESFIDTNKFDDIFCQLNLLEDLCDVISVFLVASNSKIVRVFCCDGLMQYFTDRKSNKTPSMFSTADFENFEKYKSKINIKYGEALISVVYINEDTYFIMHNELMDKEEINAVKFYVESNLKKYGFSNK